MRTDREQSDENREEAGLEEALKLWVEIRQVDQKKGWERLEAEIGRQYGLRRQERRRRLGYFRCLAAVGACKLAPVVLEYCMAGHVSAEPGMEKLLNRLELSAPLKLDINSGAGEGAV